MVLQGRKLEIASPVRRMGLHGGCAGKESACNAQSLGWEDALEKGMAIHSSILAWTIPWTEEPDGLQSTGSQRVGYNWTTNRHLLCLLIVSMIFSCFLFKYFSWKMIAVLICIDLEFCNIFDQCVF